MVLPHLDDAYGLARWLTGNGADAEDVVQDACMRALASLDAAVVERPRAWVLAIVRNTAFTWLAKNRPEDRRADRRREVLEAAAAAEPGARAPNPEEALIAAADESGAGSGDRGAAASFQGSRRHARHQRVELSRNRRGDRRAAGNGDVAAGAGAGAADRQAREADGERGARRSTGCCCTPRWTANSTPPA